MPLKEILADLDNIRSGSKYILEKVPLEVDGEALNKLEELLKTKGALQEQEENLQSLLNISNEQMEQFYQEAIKLFNTKETLLTKSVFLFLIALNPTIYPFWLGLAAAEWQLGDLPQAEKFYREALSLDLSSPEPPFYAAQFFEKTKNYKEAIKLYNDSIDKCHELPEYSTVEEMSKNGLHRILTEEK